MVQDFWNKTRAARLKMYNEFCYHNPPSGRRTRTSRRAPRQRQRRRPSGKETSGLTQSIELPVGQSMPADMPTTEDFAAAIAREAAEFERAEEVYLAEETAQAEAGW